MLRSVKNLLDVARGQLGYCEKKSNANLDSKTANAGSNNYTKYARDLYKAGYYQASKQGFEWCDMFVDWCFYTLCGNDAVVAQKMTFQSGPYGAGCGWSARYYKNAGRFHTSNPMPGDQIFFRKYAHTGIVESVSSTTITTIEGNASNKVKRCTYPINSSKIDGYGRPEFEEEPVEIPPVTDEDIDVSYEEYIVKPGDSWWRIAANKLGDGNKMDELAKFNGTTIAKTLHPDMKIKIPVETDGEYWVYTVETGDSWWGLAAEFLGSGNKMYELAKYNGTTIAKTIHPGDSLKVPYNEDVVNNTTPPAEIEYTVKIGESWWSIAEKHMGSGNKMYELAKYNGKNIHTVIHPGTVIKIPK